MMKRWVGGVIIVLGLGAATHPVLAAGWLYRHIITSPSVAPIGQSVPGLPLVRRVITTSDIQRLPLADRATLQPEYTYSASFVPNDPQFPLQWNFSALHVPEAWDTGSNSANGGDPKIIVAVLDTGLAYTNEDKAKAAPDFAPSTVWTNTKEIPNDGIDNDGNGYVDDVHGWNFLDNTPKPIDDNGHGTHISMTIAEATNNNIGATGIAFNTTVMPLKVLDTAGEGSTSTIAAAIGYAVDNGANIINLSLGGNASDPILAGAIKDAEAQGVVIVAAAGNEGASSINYPARYSGVIAVGSVRYDLTRATYSNFGPGLTVMAPGGDVSVDQNNDGVKDGIVQQTCADESCSSFGIALYEGTSQAAAHVSGVAALLEACGVSGASILNILTSTATDLGPSGPDLEYGAGLVNAQAALASSACTGSPPESPGAVQVSSVGSGGIHIGENVTYPYRRPVFRWTGPSGAVYGVAWTKGTAKAVVHRQTATSFQPTISADGVYTLTVTNIDGLGRVSSSQKFVYHFQASVLLVGTQKGVVSTVNILDRNRQVIRTVNAPAKLDGVAVTGLRTDHGARQIGVTAIQNGQTLAVTDTHGKVIMSVTPFGTRWHGQMGIADIHQPNAPVKIAAVMGNDGSDLVWITLDGKIKRQGPLYANDRHGLTAASGDLDGDASDELIVGQKQGSEIRIYDAAGQRRRVIQPLGATYHGGWLVTTAFDPNLQHNVILAVQNVTSGQPKAFVLDDQGTVLLQWVMIGLPVGRPLSIRGSNLSGDGKSRLLVLTDTGTPIFQQWTLSGKLEIQKNLGVTTTQQTLSTLE